MVQKSWDSILDKSKVFISLYRFLCIFSHIGAILRSSQLEKYLTVWQICDPKWGIKSFWFVKYRKIHVKIFKARENWFSWKLKKILPTWLNFYEEAFPFSLNFTKEVSKCNAADFDYAFLFFFFHLIGFKAGNPSMVKNNSNKKYNNQKRFKDHYTFKNVPINASS